MKGLHDKTNKSSNIPKHSHYTFGIHSHTQQHTKNILDIVHQKTDLPSRQKLQEKVKENEQHVLFPI